MTEIILLPPFSWFLSGLVGFLSAIGALATETLLTIVGQVLAVIPTTGAGDIIQQSVVFLAVIALIEEVMKFVTARSFTLFESKTDTVFAGLGFSALEPLLFWSFLPVTTFLPSLATFTPNVLLHTATFLLYSVSRSSGRLAPLFLAGGSIVHVAFNVLLAADRTVPLPVLGIMFGALLIAFLLLPAARLRFR